MLKNTSILYYTISFLSLAVLTSCCFQQTVIYDNLSSEKILTAVSNSVGENDIVSAVVQIKIVTFNGYYSAKAAFMIKKPSYVRLELLPVIGTPGFFLAASPEKMSIFLPAKGEFYYGQPTIANLQRFLPWPIDLEELVMICSGTYPSLKDGLITYQSYPEKDLLRIEMTAQSGSSQIIWVVKNNRLLKLVRRDEQGKEVYNVQYDNYEEQNPIAGEITINMADGVTSVSIKYLEVKIEQASDLSIFNLPVPDNIKTIPMD